MAATMAIMVAEVYDALRDAGASEEKARAAATAMAMHEPRFDAIASEMRLMRWMLGFNLALTVAVLLKLFVH
jgi:hypothetical protein